MPEYLELHWRGTTCLLPLEFDCLVMLAAEDGGGRQSAGKKTEETHAAMESKAIFFTSFLFPGNTLPFLGLNPLTSVLFFFSINLLLLLLSSQILTAFIFLFQQFLVWGACGLQAGILKPHWALQLNKANKFSRDELPRQAHPSLSAAKRHVEFKYQLPITQK